MTKAIVVNGSPNADKGNTGFVLAHFVAGMADAGAEVDMVHVAQLDIRACTGELRCWYRRPGECYIKDDMRALYPRLCEADLLVLATPVYIPLPGEMQNLMNRLCPLAEPRLVTREGRTRARFREGVHIARIALVCTGGWWERENASTVVRIAQEFAEVGSVPFAGAVLRPHADLMRRDGEVTEEGQAVCAALRQAGEELICDGSVADATLEAVARPLISREAYQHALNAALDRVNRRAADA
ncbi:MAG: flavodoxin family protein [Anaerolineae bacterium]|nr:flavodoxin family protein [Anaerolineae bacterium]